MRFKTGLVIGLGVGYVLGAKAGRERYEQIVSAARQFLDDERVSEATTRGRAVFDQSSERARSVVSGGISGASEFIRQRTGDGSAG